MNAIELRAQARTAAEEASAIFDAAETEKRSPTAEEIGKANELTKRSEDLVAQAKAMEAARAQRDALREKPEEKRAPISAPAESKELRLGKRLQAIADKAGHGFRTLGREYLREVRATGMSEGVEADGGALVDTEIVNTIYARAHESAQLLGRCWNLPVTGNSNGIKIPKVDESSRVNGSRWGGVTAYWKGEAVAYTSSKPTFGEFKLDLEKLTGLWYLTDEILEDAALLGALAERAFGEELGYRCQCGIINGNGVGQPLGIINSAATVSVAKENGQDADTVVFENIVKMWSRMEARCRPNSIWIYNQDVEPQLYAMHLAVGAGGVPVYLPANGLSGTPYATLMGRPCIPIEQCPTLGDTGDIMLVNLGDAPYVWISKGGMKSAESMHVAFTSGEVVFRMTYRANGAPLYNAPLTPASGSANTLSGFVKLDARA